MSVVESFFPTALHAADRYYAWRVMPWWTGEDRSCRQRSLLRLLALAHKDRLDLVPLLNNYASEQIGLYRLRVQRLARRIADGTPIVEALEQTPEVIGDELVLTIRFAAQTGTLSETYEELLSTRDAAAGQPRMRLQHAIVYAVISLLMIGGVLTFLALFVFPVLMALYAEYGFDVVGGGPFAFALFMAISDHFTNNFHLYILAIVFLAFLFWAMPSRRMLRRLLPRWFRDPLQTRTSEVLRLLAIACEAGRPVSASLSTLAHYHFDSEVRQKLLLARNQIEQGGDEWTSLYEVGLLSAAESQALANSSSQQSRVWTLKRLAAWKRSQVFGRRDRNAAMVLPGVTLVIAAIVLLICSAVFSFLSFIIETLS